MDVWITKESLASQRRWLSIWETISEEAGEEDRAFVYSYLSKVRVVTAAMELASKKGYG